MFGIRRIQNKFHQGVMAILELAGMLLSGCGFALAVFLGKIWLALICVLLLLGMFFRFTARKQPAPQSATVSSGSRLLSAFLALLVASIVVEASNLPVRFDQPGFEKSNWLIVLALLLTLYYGFLAFIRKR